MDRIAYYQQVKVALAHARRKLISYGAPLSVVQLAVVISGFVVLQSYPDKLPYYFAVALPVSAAALLVWIISISKVFKRFAPHCPSCAQPLAMLTRRKAVSTGLCPYCQEALFGP
jgi:hypothetical protein